MEPLKFSPVRFPTSLPPLILNPIATSILLAAVIAILISSRKNSKIPHANPPSWFSPTIIKQLDAVKHGVEIVDDARKRFPNKPYRMINTNGEIIVLPLHLVNTIRNEDRLSFSNAVTRVGSVNHLDEAEMLIVQDFHANIAGFNATAILDHQGQVLQNLARKQLTKLLSKFDVTEIFNTVGG